jgi:aryl-alcohol dehydrogenase-like predicted oxidoreductase
MSQSRADATLDAVAGWGINHIDTAASYGASEDRLKPWLADHRHEVFLATKTGERDGAAARAELERSLTRMAVDHVDLVQLHNLVEPEEWEVAHGPGGVVEALVRARDEGLVGHIGVTGHGLRIAGMHVRSLRRFPFDSVLFPYNHALLAEPGYRADVEELIELCVRERVALQTIKAVARGRWAPDFAGQKFSWYEPLDDPDAIARAVRYVLSDERLFLNTTSDARLLPLIVAGASAGLTRPTEAELTADASTFGITPLFAEGDLERI